MPPRRSVRRTSGTQANPPPPPPQYDLVMFQVAVTAAVAAAMSQISTDGAGRTGSEIELTRTLLNRDTHLYAAHEERHGFPGMLGSIDCIHWNWRNCPLAWNCQYSSDYQGAPSLVLEAVASQNLWILHAYFGVAGSNNNVNVLDQSPIFDDLLSGKAPDAPFTVNGNEYKFGYYLTDGIYRPYSTFVKAFRHLIDPRDKYFKRRQEGARKDVESAFGVLKSK
ncbi:uncharacterized protein LOC111891377 [Lactuca sativa]|uniref:uncharacterized protein LOC111891377 n=1 Tax=Lactuca sativa TaxID=4236 RepID=UPI000CD82B3C|nr:uncharacterized protein LOC111891377 [Lactuca sativa]